VTHDTDDIIISAIMEAPGECWKTQEKFKGTWVDHSSATEREIDDEWRWFLSREL